MTTIPLAQIKPSPRPVRSSRDEEAMEELAQSIREQGVIAPIKVRPAAEVLANCEHGPQTCCGILEMEGDAKYGDGNFAEGGAWCDWCAHRLFAEEGPYWEIVYGHRRVEAARRAGLTEILAIIDGIDDAAALIQALIENVQREDLGTLDKARALRDIQDITGWSQHEMARRGVLGQSYVGKLLALLDEPPEIQVLIGSPTEGKRTAEDEPAIIGELHVRAVRLLGLDETNRIDVLKKAADERLTAAQTVIVAKAYRDAKTDAERDAVIKVRGDHPAFERAVSVQMGMDREEAEVSYHERKEREQYDRDVAQFLEAVRTFTVMLETAASAVNFGKFSKEGARFAMRRIDALIEKLQALKEQLNGEN